ncbi:iron-containing alcohol dehydrogenase family protein [Cnuibacter physcomitrellae]|uniref:iron-containing alcohol dehydrogenase family protein n=1 Tax=Cnuibacter physcomitrellae TaxID=1619308 RepID=UPI00217610EF|nr:iron-containing alcohol dehydrogenase family protein [Cnuibacter physcomitrellae]MCS5498319.1 iron-containing alcohol dehydrogenase family protein [Cnuibacter physcomitrellae]
MSRGSAGYSHSTPAFKTWSGDRALESLGREVGRSASRVVLVGSPSVFRSDAVDRVRAVLGDRLATEFTQVQEHSPLPVVERARDLLVDAGADAVVAVGGGSAIVTARAAVILRAEPGDPRALASRREGGRMVSPRLDEPKIPIWIAPTTPSTAYAKAGTAILDPDAGERLALYDPKTRARGVAFDPVLAATAPAGLVRSASLNALSLAVEGLLSEGGDPLADALLAHALRLAVRWIPLIEQEEQARLHLMAAALLSGQGSDYARGGLAQGLSHIVGPRSSVANGTVEAMLLPAAIRLEAVLSGSRAPLVAAVLGIDGDDPSDVARAIERVSSTAGLPAGLRDVGIAEDSLPDLAARARDDWSIASRALAPTADQLTELLRSSW